jgi:hypothetical protein
MTPLGVALFRGLKLTPWTTTCPRGPRSPLLPPSEALHHVERARPRPQYPKCRAKLLPGRRVLAKKATTCGRFRWPKNKRMPGKWSKRGRNRSVREGMPRNSLTDVGTTLGFCSGMVVRQLSAGCKFCGPRTRRIEDRGKAGPSLGLPRLRSRAIGAPSTPKLRMTAVWRGRCFLTRRSSDRDAAGRTRSEANSRRALGPVAGRTRSGRAGRRT